jgi:hypothetical protein
MKNNIQFLSIFILEVYEVKQTNKQRKKKEKEKKNI